MYPQGVWALAEARLRSSRPPPTVGCPVVLWGCVANRSAMTWVKYISLQRVTPGGSRRKAQAGTTNRLCFARGRAEGADPIWLTRGLAEPVLLPVWLNHDLILAGCCCVAQLIPARLNISSMVFFSQSDNLNIISEQFPAGTGFFCLSVGKLVDLKRARVGEEIQKGRTRNTGSADVCRLQNIMDKRTGW